MYKLESHGTSGTSEPRNPRKRVGTWILGMDSQKNRRAYGAPIEPGTWNLQEPTRREGAEPEPRNPAWRRAESF